MARQLSCLGINLRNAVNTVNPDAILLDGFLGILHALSTETLDGMLRTQALDEVAGPAKIYLAATER
ncbi:hypothetical protein [Pseudarthrobacter sp. AB1]|uniref:hypothetical protein n=1 Tax=Pseudarthrobacter sp. AB1 TaxID=2138309 RepID=UPI00186B7D54|nr:hypothetical protein [Pseudarthrobacter sp. AB1]MBE4720357.1 hypothetical protein [Pseudarthrobacter sp. AB1]